MSGMMVLREMSVECSAKIAMTTLHSSFATMGLLSNHDLPRRHFSWRTHRASLLIMK
jgi:hypothetical protein